MLIVGLGNPGKKYQKTRHNLGFRAVEEFQKENNFPDFKFVKKFNTEISEGVLNNEKIILAKPQTFMNLSGKAVKKLTYNLPARLRLRANSLAGGQLTRPTSPASELAGGRATYNLWVIHDDIDLLLGKIRIVKNRGAGGHKGVESIIEELKKKNFIRFRIGISPENREQRTENNIEKFVLQKFNKEEEKVVKEVIKKIGLVIDFALKKGLEQAMNKYNS